MYLWNFWNFSSKTKVISNFLKITRVIYPQKCPSQAYGYWLITPNQQSICIETNIFFNSRQLQNNFVNNAILITISCVIRDRDILGKQGKKPQMIDRVTWKVIEYLQLHILHQRKLYWIGKVMPGFRCAILGYLGQ